MMTGLVSTSAGALILPQVGSGQNIVYDLVGEVRQDPAKAQYLYAAARDWREISGATVDNLVESATSEYWVDRSVSLLRMVLSGLDESLAVRVFQEIEELLEKGQTTPEKTLARLLIAPLKDTGPLVEFAKLALSNSLSVTAALLDELRELQPLLCRFTDMWLNLPMSVFEKFSETKEEVWLTLVEQGDFCQLLTAGNSSEFTKVWSLFAFCFVTPQSRASMSVLSRAISEALFPQDSEKINGLATASTETYYEDSTYVQNNLSASENFKRVRKQIDAITKAVASGNDVNAKKFLRELVVDQETCSDDKSHVVKSLCSIAQKCGEMFRMDFERECLDKAISILPHDAWTLIQYGDHLKRSGLYTTALKMLKSADLYGESEIAKTSEADVYAHQGYYEKAISTYKTVTDWNNKPNILSAIADNLRKLGRFELAEAQYQEILRRVQDDLLDIHFDVGRIKIGTAEIAKRRGDFSTAEKIYRETTKFYNGDERGLLYCKLGLCHTYKSNYRYDKAVTLIDEVVQQYPFALDARFIRGSILGLLGREEEALVDLSCVETVSWREWLRYFCRGLILLRVNRYSDAKEDLIVNLHNAVASGEERALSRMASVLCYLWGEDIPAAEKMLGDVPEFHDSRSQYLSLVLRLHCATSRNDAERIKHLRKEISLLLVVDKSLETVVEAIDKNDFSQALSGELQVLLELAA